MSSAAALKVSMAASVYRTRPYDLHRLRRTIATAAVPNAASSVDSSRTIPAVAAKASLALNSKAELISAVAWTTTLPSCAPSAHVKATNLGFRGHTHNNSNRRSFAFSSSSSLPSSSSVDKGPSAASEMGAENDKFDDSDGWSLDHRPQPPPSPSQPQSSKFLTLPTVLTLGRVAAVPVLLCTFYVDSWWGTTATTSIFIAAAVTDWLDGYIARKMKLGTAFGAFLDPVADKLMVAATLVLLCTKPLEISTYGHLPWLLTVPAIVIIGREITMSAVREWAASQNSKLLEAVAVNNLGKWKTATQMTALTILLAARDSSLAGARMLVAPGVILLNISAGLAMWSLVVYMRKIWKVLLK